MLLWGCRYPHPWSNSKGTRKRGVHINTPGCEMGGGGENKMATATHLVVGRQLKPYTRPNFRRGRENNFSSDFNPPMVKPDIWLLKTHGHYIATDNTLKHWLNDNQLDNLTVARITMCCNIKKEGRPHSRGADNYSPIMKVIPADISPIDDHNGELRSPRS